VGGKEFVEELVPHVGVAARIDNFLRDRIRADTERKTRDAFSVAVLF
jgi:hypothetical protein